MKRVRKTLVAHKRTYFNIIVLAFVKIQYVSLSKHKLLTLYTLYTPIQRLEALCKTLLTWNTECEFSVPTEMIRIYNVIGTNLINRRVTSVTCLLYLGYEDEVDRHSLLDNQLVHSWLINPVSFATSARSE